MFQLKYNFLNLFSNKMINKRHIILLYIYFHLNVQLGKVGANQPCDSSGEVDHGHKAVACGKELFMNCGSGCIRFSRRFLAADSSSSSPNVVCCLLFVVCCR